MNLDEAQRKKVADWIGQGLKLSEIQNRITTELGLKLTYMEVRLLVDDLKLTPKDVDPPKEAVPVAPAPEQGSPAPAAPAPSAGVSLTVDQLARPGAVVSGKVTFSDGQRAEWYIDQTGRLALAAQQPGYRPSPADVQQFQATLEQELSKAGF